MNKKKKFKLKVDRHQKLDLFARALDLPEGILSNGSKTELYSNKSAIVDGCKGVLDYCEECIKLNVGEGIIEFKGRNLEIVSFEGSHAIIKGYIITMNFGVL